MTSLTGETISNNLSLDGENESNGSIQYSLTSEDAISFRKLKLYLIENFMEPLIYKELENVNLNLYNFSYILNRLSKFKSVDPKEVELYTKIVEFVQKTVATYNTTADLMARVYANGSMPNFVNELPMITLRAEYEVYNALYGRPVKFSYNKKILREIKLILSQYPGILVKDIEKIIDYRLDNTIIHRKLKKNDTYDTDGNVIKLEYRIYKKLFKCLGDKYDQELLDILRKIIEDYPEFTLLDIKKYIYENHRIYTHKLLDNIYEKPITLKDRYDALFGKPGNGDFYKKNYLNLIEEIIKKYPTINNDELAVEFEFKQPIWGELLLKNQTINAILYKDSRFRVNIPDAYDSLLLKNNEDVIIRPNDDAYSLNKKGFDDGEGRKTRIKNNLRDNSSYVDYKSKQITRNKYI